MESTHNEDGLHSHGRAFPWVNPCETLSAGTKNEKLSTAEAALPARTPFAGFRRGGEVGSRMQREKLTKKYIYRKNNETVSNHNSAMEIQQTKKVLRWGIIREIGEGLF